uniref:C2H2-type domain-containing protein n=1 Tax=Oncorhynchus mykiss TaxID=8022 RepID=A0A8K9WTI1_ONCMY
MGLRDRRLSEQLQMDPEITLDEAVTCIRQKQQDLPENTFKATSNAANVEGVLSHSKQQCPANSQCQSEKNQNSERPQQPQTTQENEEETHKKGGDCLYCDKSFSEPGELKIHMEVHSQERPYLCPDCGKQFKQLWVLKNHQLKHTEKISPQERHHYCSDCGKSFTRRHSLRRHQQETHTDEKPYHCSNCDKSFFERHTRIHTASGKKPFLCTDCGDGFTTLRRLEEHQRTHTGEKPYHCTECGKRFAREWTLKIADSALLVNWKPMSGRHM